MDTDIVAGITSEIDPVLVLSGVTQMGDLKEFAYGPYLILGGVYEIPSDDESHRITEEELEEASRRVSIFF
jgi:NagD protein